MKINWLKEDGEITRTKIIKSDFTNVNKLWTSLPQGLNSNVSYEVVGGKFDNSNAQFFYTEGFDDYKPGSATNNPNKIIRPNRGTLTFNVIEDKNGNSSVGISFDKKPSSNREQVADVLRGVGKLASFAGDRAAEGGYVAAIIPGTQEIAVPFIGLGKPVS